MMEISMFRFLMFFMLGPLVAVITAMMYEIWSGALPGIFGAIFAAALLLFVWPLFAIAGAIDQHLAHYLPGSLRAFIMALLGATIAVGLLHVVVRTISPAWWLVPVSIWAPLALIDAVVMGLCALLSEDFRNQDSAR
jgi:hypothetical protein